MKSNEIVRHCYERHVPVTPVARRSEKVSCSIFLLQYYKLEYSFNKISLSLLLVSLCMMFFSEGIFASSSSSSSCPLKNILEIQIPQFQIVSAAKTGSTSLYAYLCQLPSVKCIAKKKELNLLRNERKFKGDAAERENFLKWYLKEGFGIDSIEMSAPFATFEASIHYYHHRIALENLHQILPCSKIIWVLRNPLPRALSEYMHQAVKSKNYPTFSYLLQSEVHAIQACGNLKLDSDVEKGFESDLFKCLAKYRLKKYMLSTAFYGYFISAWMKKFSRESHLFIDYEMFRKSPQSTVEQISNFLGLPDAPPTLKAVWKFNKADTRSEKANQIRNNLKLTPKLLKSIRNTVQPHVNRMYELIEKNFTWKIDSLA